MKSNVLRFDYWFSFNYKRLRSILGWQLTLDFPGGIRFMNKFLSNKILDCAKVKDNASFLMEKEPITVDGTKYFKIMLSSPIIVKRSPSKKATIDKR